MLLMPKTLQDDTHAQVESGTMTLHQELDDARQALRLQTARCRQVDAALSRRLEQKDLEVKRWKDLRDQQLSYLMRALMMLEAKLRREQRSIRSMLGERDSIIRAQQLEISRLKKLLDCEVRQEVLIKSTPEEALTPGDQEYECDVKPDLISSLGISHSRRDDDKFSTPNTTDNEDSQSNLDSLQLSFYEIGSQPESLVSNLSAQSCNGACDSFEQNKECHDHINRLSPPNTTPTEPVCNPSPPASILQNNNKYSIDLKSFRSKDIARNMNRLEVNVHNESQYPVIMNKNILSPVKEETSKSLLSCGNSPVRSNPCKQEEIDNSSNSHDLTYQDCKPSPSTLLQEVRISGRNEYEDNPVLNCVNQILLRDQEEFLEEQRALRLKEQEKSKKEAESLNNKKLTKSTENLSLLNEQIIVQHSPVKKVYPPIECLTSEQIAEQMRKQDVFEEDSYKVHNQISSPKKRMPTKDKKLKNGPPALPPKPQRLLLSKSMDQQTLINSILPQLNGGGPTSLDLIKKRASLPNPTPDSELYVISNSAIDDEILHKLQGRKIQSCSELPGALSSGGPLAQTRENIYAPGLSHPTHKPPIKPNTATVIPQIQKSPEFKTPSKKTANKDEESTRNSIKHTTQNKILSPSNYIKVASPVSSLLNSEGPDVLDSSAEENIAKKTSPNVSQIVRKFEDLGTKIGKDAETLQVDDNSTSLQKNFEEFRLDECDMDSFSGDGRPEGDGAENRFKTPADVLEARVSYENFLEATGLSQKSIMTPSRLFSNHKSVMKPKDVKHRSRVKAAAVVDRFNNNINSPSGSIVKYWTEPFL